jgi:hypothetical protein
MFWMFWLETLIISFFDSIRILFTETKEWQISFAHLNWARATKFLIIRVAIFFFYSLFIIAFVGIVRNDSDDRMKVFYTLLFHNTLFNISILLIFLIQLNRLIKGFLMSGNYRFSRISDYTAIFDARQIFMHIAIVLGSVVSMILFKGKYGTIALAVTFCLLKIGFEYYWDSMKRSPQNVPQTIQ